MDEEITQNKGIRFPIQLIKEIEAVSKRERRNFSTQVIYFCERGVVRYQEEKTGGGLEIASEE